MRYVFGKIRSDDHHTDNWEFDPPLIMNYLAVDGPVYTDTGLLGPDGHPIYRLPIPIGFGRDEEW